jgi:hypothetical protein
MLNTNAVPEIQVSVQHYALGGKAVLQFTGKFKSKMQ